ncbi:MAG: sigma 54-interacting transcriptional regulator [Proteobacteria bacterium]|nr:sigma 54-interacting transcriptional regulator [Pseudomonadota bacterium]
MIIQTKEGLCKKCYSCIRGCPVKAIKVQNDQAFVLKENCISCGNCIKLCSQDAKAVEMGMSIHELLQSGKTKIALLAPSFVSYYNDSHPLQLVAALRKLGFDYVYETAYGAELVAESYRGFLNKAISEKNENTFISSPCPAIVNLVCKYYPEFIPNLVNIVSPMIAMGRFLKERFKDAHITFIGPCVAKKSEIHDNFENVCIDNVWTFKELDCFFSEFNIDPKRKNFSDFDGYFPRIGRAFALSGGLLKTASIGTDILETDIIVVDGKDEVLSFFEALKSGRIKPKFVDMLFCKGCIDGPVMQNKGSLHERVERVVNYVKNYYFQSAGEEYPFPDKGLLREFSKKDRLIFIEPKEEDIKRVLDEMKVYNGGENLNCGACGYENCYEKAKAVVIGLAEIEMCLPYLLNKMSINNLTLLQDYQVIQNELYKDKDFGFILGKTHKMREIWDQIEKVAPTSTTVLLRGESGTGKEMLAILIHQKSNRKNKPMITVNCTTLNENLLESELFGHVKGSFTGATENKKGLFEAANNGTIFLDEIGDMPINLQTKLLRVLQNGEIRAIGSTEVKKVDVRVIAATNRNLEELIKEGKFREDLYYRLNVFTITLPPLRERKDDIPYFLHHLIDSASKKIGKKIKSVEKEVIRYLKAYHWPGNIRELANVVERAVILAQGEELKLKDFPIYIQNTSPELESLPVNKNLWDLREEHLQQFERNLIKRFLKQSMGNVKKAAELAGIPRPTFHNLMKKHNIKREDIFRH